jgi:hypothetical protein
MLDFAYTSSLAKDIPLILNDLAETIKHAIVVVNTGDGGSGLKLTAKSDNSLAIVTGGQCFLRPGIAYIRVLSTSNGYLRFGYRQ